MERETNAHRRALRDYVGALGGTGPEFEANGDLHFDLQGVRGHVRIKEGGSRIRGSVVIDQVDDVAAAADWVESQPLPPTSELTLWGSEGEEGLLRLVWERTIRADLGVDDPIAAEVVAFRTAWSDRADVLLEARDFAMGDPRDAPPQQAWLVIGDDASWPTADVLAEQRDSGDAGVFEPLWTAAKQTQPGDLLLFYFTGARKAVHFVARAASAAFYTADLEVKAQGEVRDQQWWVFHTPLIEVQPVSFGDLKAAANDQLILKGRSGKFLPPAAINALRLEAVRAEDRDELERILQLPTGRAELPDPETMTSDDVKRIAGGALRLESDVERYIVEPLLRTCLADTDLTYKQQFSVGAKRADFVVLDENRPCCVIEVKLAINDTGDWAHSPDLRQSIGYAAALDCAAVLIDTQRIVLIDRGASAPARVIERHDLTPGIMLDGNLYDLAEHLGVPFVWRSNGYNSWRERPGFGKVREGGEHRPRRRRPADVVRDREIGRADPQ